MVNTSAAFKKLTQFLLCALLLTPPASAQETPVSLIPFGSTWKYDDNGPNPGTWWRSLLFPDLLWKTGKGTFGYGIKDAATELQSGKKNGNGKDDDKDKNKDKDKEKDKDKDKDKDKGTVTVYFRKAFTLADPAAFGPAMNARIKRDDGAVVYVNGEEVYRTNMPAGTITPTTLAKNAADQGRTPQAFTIKTTSFRRGVNLIAVEVHQHNANSPDMAFDLELTGTKIPAPPPPPAPSVRSILRYAPATQITTATSVTFRTTFSAAVRGVDAADFTVTTVSGTVKGSLAATAVKAVNDSVYEVTVSAITGTGNLRLDLKPSGTGITNTTGAALSGGYTAGQTYTIEARETTPPDPAPFATGIYRHLPATDTTTATSLTFRATFSEKVSGVDAADFSITTLQGTVRGMLAATAVKAVNDSVYEVTVSAVTGTGSLRLDLKPTGTGITDAAGNLLSGGYASGQTYTLQARETVPVDPAPRITGIFRHLPLTDTTTATSLTFRATFSEKVKEVDAADFTLTTLSGTVKGVVGSNAVTAVSDSVYDITVSSITGTGSLRLDLKSTGTGILDVLGNLLSGGYTAGQLYNILPPVVVTDPNAPLTVLSINRQSPATVATNASSVTFRVTFSKKVTGVDATDFSATPLSGNVRGTLAHLALETSGTVGTEAVAPVGTDGTTYDVSVRALAGSGTLRLDLKASGTGIQDADGNALSGGFTGGQTYTVQSSGAGFASFSDIAPLPIATHTMDKPQAKVWNYAGKWWSVLATTDGTAIYRLDGTTWTEVLPLVSNSNCKADVQVMEGVVHILLFRGGGENTYLMSAEYDGGAGTYRLWSQRAARVTVVLEPGAETATIALDGTGRMWMASDGEEAVLVRWSDAPYTSWSAPITVASGIMEDDICALVALPGKIGVLWSNQNTQRFGFKTHTNAAPPATWSADELPGAGAALNLGHGLADDHLNMIVGADGTLYCAVKTGFDTPKYPKVSLLVRRPAGTWDPLYPVTANEGTRPIVLLNEAARKLKVVYCSHENGGDILYRESSTSSIAFGAPLTLVSGNYLYNYVTATHQAYSSDVVLLATNLDKRQAVGVLATDNTALFTGTASTAPLTTLATATTTAPAPELQATVNPLTTGTVVRFSLPEGGPYSLTLQNLQGGSVKLLKQGTAEAGQQYSVAVDGTTLINGIYLVQLQTRQGITTLKLVVER
ncbi:T9SS type A sorting domain-containing protein [Paraflavisolibacter sp. H34]|uniref:T9SS type A sorting domain-containing protein n=1 Tax=Huijunlia imazamoxiresistens TaxID=3127457 RepID=UPI0030161438